MFTVKALLITNSREDGITASPYIVGPHLDAIADQFSLLYTRTVTRRNLTWAAHGNIVFVSYNHPDAPVMHFAGCPTHKISLLGPTFIFHCPMDKQHRATRLSISGNFTHIAESFDESDGDLGLVAHLFDRGLGNTSLKPATDKLISIDASPESFGAEGLERSRGKSAGPDPDLTGGFLGQMFDQLTAAGFEVGLLNAGPNNEVIGLMATGKEPDEPTAMIDPDTGYAQDPGFYVERQQKHDLGISIIAEVNFEPIHFPTPAAFVLATLSAYARMVALNVIADTLQPEVAEVLVNDLDKIADTVSAINSADPVLRELESPSMAKLPHEPGGLGRNG